MPGELVVYLFGLLRSRSELLVAVRIVATGHGREEKHMVSWDRVTHRDVLRALREYDRLGAERFFSAHGFAPTTTYELVSHGRRYPPKAILGTAYEFATGRRLASGDFEGGKTGAVTVLEKLGFNIQKKATKS
jgi:hypothetical protein